MCPKRVKQDPDTKSKYLNVCFLFDQQSKDIQFTIISIDYQTSCR